MKFVKSIFSGNGNVSCMRIMAMLSLFLGAGLAFYSLYKNCSLDSATPIVGVFVGSAFGGKVFQKFAEVKEGSNNNESES